MVFYNSSYEPEILLQLYHSSHRFTSSILYTITTFILYGCSALIWVIYE